MSRSWRWLLHVTAVATVLPLALVRFFPMIDTPEQVTVIATLRHWFDPAWHVREQYVLELGKSQYLLYHLVGAALALLPVDAETANRALLVGVGLAFPYAARALLRALGRDERLALFACAAFWSRPLIYGFLPYVASTPAVVYALALVVRQTRAPTRARAVALSVLGVVLFYLHVHAFLLFATTSVVLVIVTVGKRPRALLGHALWLLPASAAAVAWALHGTVALGRGSLGDRGQVRWTPHADLARDFPLWAHDVWRSHVDEATTIAFWGLLAVLAIAGVRRGSEPTPLRAWVPLACAVALYLLLPFQVGAAGMVNVRLAVFAAVLAPLVVQPAKGWTGDVPLAGAALVAFVVSANAAYHAHVAARDEAGDFDRVLGAMRPSSRLVSLVFHATSAQVDLPVWVHMGSYHRARGGGVASFSFAELPHWPVGYRADAAPPAKEHSFWEFDPCVYRNAVDGRYYDYVLTRGNVDPFRDRPPGPQWRATVHEKEWTLWEKIPGAESPAWSVPDRGPCESRRTLETIARSAHATGVNDASR